MGMLPSFKIFTDLQMLPLPKCIRVYRGLNISRIKVSLVTAKTTKSAGKNFFLKVIN